MANNNVQIRMVYEGEGRRPQLFPLTGPVMHPVTAVYQGRDPRCEAQPGDHILVYKNKDVVVSARRLVLWRRTNGNSRKGYVAYRGHTVELTFVPEISADAISVKTIHRNGSSEHELILVREGWESKILKELKKALIWEYCELNLETKPSLRPILQVAWDRFVERYKQLPRERRFELEKANQPFVREVWDGYALPIPQELQDQIFRLYETTPIWQIGEEFVSVIEENTDELRKFAVYPLY